SQVFVIGTIVIISQLNFIRDQDLGFAPEAIINIEIPENNNSKKATLKTEIERMNGVEQVSLIYTNPTSGSVSVTDFHLPNSADEYLSALKYGDANYLDIFDISILEGRPLGNSDTINQIVVNEEWVKYSGMTSNDEAVGTMVRVHGREVPVVGVMQDFHSTSLRNKLTPLMLMNNINSYRRLAIKLNLSNLDQTTAQIRNTWKELFPEYDFEYRFVDDQIAEFYEGVSDMAFIFGFFSMIAILIGCLGLFGLASFMVNQKIKEIGVRKVLGASVGSILRLFSKEYFILVVVAFLFAAPIAGYIMEQWLQNFEYKINMGWVIFASGIIVTLAISMLTVSYKSIRAATANPVDSLRTE
ncbi:MAG: FtsX-like permease family protein, partial [Bacteroidota bacterium]